MQPLAECLTTGCGGSGGVAGHLGHFLAFMGGACCGNTSSFRGLVICVARLVNKSDSCTLCLVNSHCRSRRCLSRMYS